MVKFIYISFAILCVSCSMMVDEKGEVEDAGYSTSSENSTESAGTSVDNSDSSNDTLGNSDALTYSDTVSTTTQDDTGSVSDTYTVHDTETTTYPECDPSFGPCCDETGHFRGKDVVCNPDSRWVSCDVLCGKKAEYYNVMLFCTGESSACNPNYSSTNIEIIEKTNAYGGGITTLCTDPGFKCSDSSGHIFGLKYDAFGNILPGENECQYFVDPAVSGCGIY